MDEEKALEKLHTSVEGVLPANDPNRPYLNDIDIVSGIVRDFGSEVLRRYPESLLNADEKAQFLSYVEAECNRLGWLFIGYDPETEANSPYPYQRSIWNTPESLGTYLRIHLVPSDEENRFAARDAFMQYAADIVKLTVDKAGEPVEEWGWMLDAQTEALIDGLMGIDRDAIEMGPGDTTGKESSQM